jgi:hypothetical protein
MCSLEAVTLTPQLLRRLCGAAQRHRKVQKKKTVDKQVPNSMPEQGKQLLESFALVCWCKAGSGGVDGADERN